jgi:hypothetical protein
MDRDPDLDFEPGDGRISIIVGELAVIIVLLALLLFTR